MQRIKTPVIFTLIVILAAAAGSQYYANRAYRLQLEAGYRRAFRELAVHIDGMETELSKLLVANSPTQQFGGLANVLRLVYAAQANLGQLPIHGLNLARIENLLARVQAVAVEAAQGMHETKPLNAVRNELSQLYEQVRYVNVRRLSWLSEAQNPLDCPGRFHVHSCRLPRLLSVSNNL